MNTVDKIVTEWAFRCKKGYPDLNNPQDMRILSEIYAELGINTEATKPRVNKPRRSLYDINKEYIFIDIPGKKEDYYIHISDYDEKTKTAKPGAQYYVQVNKETKAGKDPYIYKEKDPFAKEKEETDQQQEPEKPEPLGAISGEELSMVIQQLKNAGVPDDEIQRTTGTAQNPNPNFRALANINAYVAEGTVKKSIENFGYLYKYKVPRGGKGELIPFVSIRGAKLGGSNEKDIIDKNGRILEVKELPGKGSKREFALASGASAAGSTFIEHLQTFLKAVWPYRRLPNIRGIEKLNSLDSISPRYIADLQEILDNLPHSEKDLTQDAEEIKINGVKYSVKKGVPYTVELDDNGNLVPNQSAPTKAAQADVELRKLLKHPWVQDKSKHTPMKDLDVIKQAYLQSINYLMLWTSENSAVIIDATKPEQTSNIGISRVATGNLSLTYFVNK